ncbi:MAG TPA: hypothetical protein VII23_10375 [Terriglobales bacterium]
MQSTQTLNFVKFTACMVLVIGLSGSALASCGDSLTAMATAASVHTPSKTAPQALSAVELASETPSPDGSGVQSSIVGMWHILFESNGQTVQEAYQVWNTGGTEVHNPNVDPRTGNVCLGTWVPVGPQTYKLVHRVWWYDASGDFLGTIHLTEVVSLTNRGSSHGGSFALDFYDQNNNFQFEVAGNVVAERITVE